MENKNWIERLLLFIPKSKYNVVKLWDEEYKCNVIAIYEPGPCIYLEYYLYYDVKKDIYNVGDHSCDWHCEGGALYEDINNIDTACAALIFYIWEMTNKEKYRNDGEGFEEWRNRIKQLANDLFVEIIKYFDVKKSDKSFIFKYGKVNGVNKYGTVDAANKIITKRNLKKSCLFTCKQIEVLQIAEKEKG